MRAEVELIIEMYKIQINRSEHYENQRSTITNLVLTLAAALVALTTFDGILNQTDFLNGILIVLVGLFGFIASKFHGRRTWRHGKRAAEFRKELDLWLPNAEIEKIRNRIIEEKTYLHNIWEGFHLAVIAIGILIVILSVRGN